MIKENIDCIRLDPSGKVTLKPSRTQFDLIYRSAAGVEWNSKDSELVAKGTGESPFREALQRIIMAVESEYGIRLAPTLSTTWISFDDEVRMALAPSWVDGANDLLSGEAAQLSTDQEEVLLLLSEFRRFSDDSSVFFKLLARNSYFEIRNFDFYSDESYFERFLSDLKSVYGSLSGTAELKPTYENDLVKFIADGRGHISIQVKAKVYNETINSCDLTIEIDQSFLPGFISSLEGVYEKLGYEKHEDN